MSKKKAAEEEVVTRYVVRDNLHHRFLKKKAYSGRTLGLWGTRAEAYVFETRKAAHSCASNINLRRPEKGGSFYARTIPVQVKP